MKKPFINPDTFDANYEERRERFVPATAPAQQPNHVPDDRGIDRHKDLNEEALPQVPERKEEED